MHVLILGGTSFVGRVLAEEAVSRGYEVTLFNRGTKTAPAGTKTLIGDRLAPNGLAALDGLTVDAVIDTWSSDPGAVSRAVETLLNHAGQYAYVSSASVYDHDAIEPGKLYDESTRLFDVDAPDSAKSEYQFNKRSAEIAIEKSGFQALIVRPGVILGPHESVIIERGRLPWWLNRLHRGGRTLAPGPEDLILQLVDARDLANFMVDGIEKKLRGAFNILGEPQQYTMKRFLVYANEVVGNQAELVWKEPKEILDAGIKPWIELPLWIDKDSPQYTALYSWDTVKAKGAGLQCRPVDETIKDTWNWMKHGELKPKPAPDGYGQPLLGLDPQKESRLLG